MAYTSLGDIWWGEGPSIKITAQYDRRRSGADMQYRLKITLNPLTGPNYFGYPIYATATIDGSQKLQATIKSASPSQWSSGIVYESGWVTASGKVSGTAALKLRIYSGSGSSRDYSYNFNLAVEPAGSRISPKNGTLGTSQSISVTRYNTAFTHTIKATCGTESVTLCTKSTSSTVTWTPPRAWAAQNTKGDTVSVTFQTTTYSGGTVVETVSVKATYSIPDGPSASFTLSDPTGYNSQFGGYVQSRSKLAIQVTAAGVYGSTITSKTAKVGGKDWSLTQPGVLTDSGSVAVTVTVKDSRGKTKIVSQTITVQPYTPPIISSLSYIRGRYVNGTWTDNQRGGDIKVTYSLNLSLPNNTASIQVQVGNTTKISLSNQVGGAKSHIITGFGTDTTQSVTVIVTDRLGAGATKAISVPTVAVPLNQNFALPGVCFGGIAEAANTVQFKYAAEFLSTVSVSGSTLADFVVESGEKTVSSHVWKYQKWHSGRVDLSSHFEAAVSGNTAIGSSYYSGTVSVSLPMTVTNATVTGTAGSLCTVCNVDVTGQSLSFRLLRPGSIPAKVWVNFTIVGNWR